MTTRGPLSTWHLALLALVPLALRVAVWRELARNPFFEALFIDARIYHETAAQIASGNFAPTTPFWQPPLYPAFLGTLYGLTGPEPDAARAAGVVLGTLSCLLVFFLARRLFGVRAGWVAWALVAANGPLIFFDLQLLGVTLGIALALGSLVLWVYSSAEASDEAASEGSASMRSSVLPRAGSGFLAGLAGITIGNMQLLAPAVIGWTLFRRTKRTSAYWVSLGAFAFAALLPPLWVTIQNYQISGEWVGVSYNSGVNYWIGNNPAYDSTVAIRPGREWVALTAEPREEGAVGYRAQSDYFFTKSKDWFESDPGAALRLQIKKLRLFVRGDEIMRNQEIYPFRPDSLFLRVLLWSNGIAFPFGLLLPLAAGSLFSLFRWKRRFDPRWRFLAFFVVLYALSVIAFFVTARFRLPIVPLLAVLVGGGVSVWIEQLKRGPIAALALPAVAIAVMGVLSARGVPTASAEFNSDAHYDLGVHYQASGDFEAAYSQYIRALELDPRNFEAMNNLAGLSLRRGNLEGAAEFLQGVLAAYPEDVRARYNLGLVFLDQGRPYDAGWELKQVVEAVPNHPKAAAKLAQARDQARMLEARHGAELDEGAVAVLFGAFRSNPSNGFMHQRLRGLLLERGREGEVAEVDRLFAEATQRTEREPSRP